jgi:hypothetical protein
VGEQKNEDDAGLAGMPTRRLLSRRRALAARLGGAERVLSGSLTEQMRRCGKAGCRCAGGEPHGPYAFFAPRTAARGRVRYVPAICYLRQSSMAQVRQHTESTRSQYGLADTAEPSAHVGPSVCSGCGLDS